MNPLGGAARGIMAGLAGLAIVGSSQLSRAEPLRALQTGPVGSGAVFVAGPAGMVEGQFGLSSAQGLARAQGSGDRILSDAQRTGVAVGALHPLSEAFWFHSGAAVRSWDYHGVSRGRRSFNERVSQTVFQGYAGPIMRRGPLLIAGEVALNFLGEETRTVETSSGTRRYTGKATSMPVVQGTLGFDLGAMFVAAGLRTFNQSKVDATVRTETGETTSLQVAERIPGELQLDLRLRQASGFDWGASVTYVMTGNGSLDPEKAIVTRTSESRPPAEVEGSMGADHVRIAAGATYHVDADTAFVGTIAHRQESWRKAEYASLELENGGGLDLGVGTQFAVAVGTVSFAANYLIPERRSFTQGDLKLIEVGETGERVDAELGAWSVVLGLTRTM